MHMELQSFLLETIYLIQPIDEVEEKSAVRAPKAEPLSDPGSTKKKRESKYRGLDNRRSGCRGQNATLIWKVKAFAPRNIKLAGNIGSLEPVADLAARQYGYALPD